MQLEYISWGALEKIKVKAPVLFSVESNEKIDHAISDLIQTYLSDQSQAGAKFDLFQTAVTDLLDQNKLSYQAEDPELNDLVVEVEWMIEDPVHDSKEYIEAQLIAYGKLISARLAYLILSEDNELVWLDPRDVMITDETWIKAEIDFDLSRAKFSNLDSSKCYFTTHGIGCSSDNQNTLTKISSYWESFFD